MEITGLFLGVEETGQPWSYVPLVILTSLGGRRPFGLLALILTILQTIPTQVGAVSLAAIECKTLGRGQISPHTSM